MIDTYIHIKLIGKQLTLLIDAAESKIKWYEDEVARLYLERRASG
jgi:hypothetical protein